MTRPAATPPPRPALFALVAGLLAGLGQAPFGLWLLSLVAFSAGIALVATAARPGRVAWCFGAGHFAAALHWIVEPFLVEPEVFGWLAPAGLIGMAGGMALFWLAAGLGVRRIAPGPARIAAFAALLALAELVRAYVMSGFPWAHPGHILIDTPALALSAIGGPHLLNALVLAAAAALAALSMARRHLAAAGLLAALALPLTFLPEPRGPVAGPDAPVVRLVQPNAAQDLKWRPDMIPVFFDRGLSLTAGGPPVDLVVWPETALPVLLEDSGPWRAAIAEAASGATVAVGVQRYPGGRARNTLAVLDPAGEVTALYDKHRLVPFGEYIPARGLAAEAGLSGLAATLRGGFWPGDGPGEIDLGDRLGTVFPMICYEAIFPQYLRRVDRPDWMLHVTNDAWFGRLSGPYQHLALARLRAAESGLPVLRAANTGVSAAIDARGHVLASLPLGEAGALDAALPPPLPPTPYARTGDLPMAAILLLLAIVAVLAPLRRQTRH
ncbi:apolipoprotein N-acyltransferase [Rhodobacterales bacterium HKCCE2091]|nr:apolipoprotein N-acyltransferase [Rhodobacterales bacterium HKCCE2091]